MPSTIQTTSLGCSAPTLMSQVKRALWSAYEHWTAPAPAPGWNASATTFLSVDENGAPVTFAPSRWLVCFVPGLRAQFWHRLVASDHKHVLMLKPNADGTWTLFEPWWSRLLVRTITTDEAVRFLHWGAMGDVLLVEEDVPGHGSQLRGWMNCVSLAAFVLGRAYCVWSPHALFTRLKAEPASQHVDVADFLERYFSEQMGPITATVLGRLAMDDETTDLRQTLVGLGRSWLSALTQPRLVALYRAAIAEAAFFPDIARSFHQHGAKDVATALARRLAAARDRQEIAVEDCQAAAEYYLGMLHGELFIQVAIGLRGAPSQEEVEAVSVSTANAFLGGARRALAMAA